ncbi:hypothetical protein ACTMTI_06940 [Nonomuraea sp. H19]|uniref:hypothetical protein n=1 Tax=Nonomuraea sp. H19 TaxID=3452206 RepID=UPI003F8CB327
MDGRVGLQMSDQGGKCLRLGGCLGIKRPQAQLEDITHCGVGRLTAQLELAQLTRDLLDRAGGLGETRQFRRGTAPGQHQHDDDEQDPAHTNQTEPAARKFNAKLDVGRRQATGQPRYPMGATTAYRRAERRMRCVFILKAQVGVADGCPPPIRTFRRHANAL